MLSELVSTGESLIHGTGVFARREIADGTLIGTYDGTPTTADGTHVLWVEDDDGGWDGISGTGLLRFLNHSRTPNVEFDGPSLYAVREIGRGEELFFDYGEGWADVP